MHILREHVGSCFALQGLRTSRAEQAERRTLSRAQVQSALDMSTPVLSMAAVEEDTSLQDVHFAILHDQNGSDRKLVCDVSPRTAKLRGQFHCAARAPSTDESDEAEPPGARSDKLVCTVCDMDFNSPGQLQEHLKGKRHRKNMTKLRQQSVAGGRRECGEKHQSRQGVNAGPEPSGKL